MRILRALVIAFERYSVLILYSCTLFFMGGAISATVLMHQVAELAKTLPMCN